MAGVVGELSSGNRSSWDQLDLERRLCHALDIAGQAVERLASNGYADTRDPGNNVRSEKLISETALLLLAASTAGRRKMVETRIHRVAQILIPFARCERMLFGICLNPALTWDYAQAHVCLSRLGYKDAGFDELLRKTSDSREKNWRERVPCRVLEQEWVSRNWSVSTQGALSRLRSSDSVLSRPMDALSGSREDLYAFTHTIMYLTDFNVRPRRMPRCRVRSAGRPHPTG